MRLRDISFSDPHENLLFDDVLFSLSEKKGDIEYLRFWESPRYFVVLGRISKMDEDVDESATQADGIPVLRRSSGGGTVLQGPGCLNYSLVLNKEKRPYLNDLRASYQWIADQVISALKIQGIHAVFHPISDIALAQGHLKFSGNAQRRGRTHILHHGTILVDFDLPLISAYLKMPKDMPVYRNVRSHKDFVANIGIDRSIFKKNLAKQFHGTDSLQVPTIEEISFLKKLIK